TWLPRLAKTKQDIKARGAVHFVHGEDVARAIVASHEKPSPGKRWIIADLRVYDWWDLISSFSALAEGQGGMGVSGEGKDKGEEVKDREMRLEFATWVGELMLEEG
ncbi:MAG: hypothetical protein M1823_007627, partial [Watsoniomyces obsoletus]